MSILYAKTSKEFYHDIKFWEGIMKNFAKYCVFALLGPKMSHLSDL